MAGINFINEEEYSRALTFKNNEAIHNVSNTEGKLFCSMAGKGVCPYEKECGECIMKDPCKNHTIK